MTEVTHARTKDYVIIQEIALQTWPLAFAGILSPRQISYMLQMMYSLDSLNEQIAQGHLFLLAKDEGISLGFISYELNYKGCGITRIHKIYILPSAQGKGLGKSLINRVMGIAIENNNYLLSLNVNRYNEAVHFYERLGFKKVREENISIGNGFVMEDAVMEKPLVEGHKLWI